MIIQGISKIKSYVALAIILLFTGTQIMAQRQMENLGRGVVATDIDRDGKDEIIFGSMVVDDNGKGLFSTGLGHGEI